MTVLLDLSNAQKREAERETTRYLCFVMVKPDRGWGGPYEQNRRPSQWQCEVCSLTLRYGMDRWVRKQIEEHHKRGHAPCEFCGKQMVRRQDGTPRQHPHNRCPAKNPGFKIEREFVKNITTREFA